MVSEKVPLPDQVPFVGVPLLRLIGTATLPWSVTIAPVADTTGTGSVQTMENDMEWFVPIT